MEAEDGEGTEHEFHQATQGVISRAWLLLNNQSSVDQFISPKYLKNIHTVENPLHALCNARSILAHKEGMFGSVEVWYKPHGIANMLSLETIEENTG